MFLFQLCTMRFYVYMKFFFLFLIIDNYLQTHTHTHTHTHPHRIQNIRSYTLRILFSTLKRCKLVQKVNHVSWKRKIEKWKLKRQRSKKCVWTDQFGGTSLPWFWQKFIVRYGARYSPRTIIQIRLLGFTYHPLWTCNQFHWFPL